MEIKDFNKMYGLPVAEYPGYQAIKDPGVRLRQFRRALQDEVEELDEIIRMVDEHTVEIQVLTALADFLTDVQVYCQSEMVKWGLPIKECMEIVMLSNASKMGADGKPIVVDGKLQKGPDYWKPEPYLRKMLVNLAVAGVLHGEDAAEAPQEPSGAV